MQDIVIEYTCCCPVCTLKNIYLASWRLKQFLEIIPPQSCFDWSTWFTLIKKWGTPVLLKLSIDSPIEGHTHTHTPCAWSVILQCVQYLLVRGWRHSVLLLWCLFRSVATFWCRGAFIRDARHFVLSLQHILYPGGAARCRRRHCAHPRVFAWGNQLSVALLVGEGICRAAGARPAYSPQGLLLRAFPLTGKLYPTNLSNTAVGRRAT